MSTPPQRLPPRPGTAKKNAKADKDKPRRSPRERAIVWSVIAILVVLVIFEARAKFQHSAAVRKLDAFQRQSRGTPMKIDQIVPLFAKQPEISTETIGTQNRKLEFKIYMWKWSGIFKTYKIQLQVDEDNEVSVR